MLSRIKSIRIAFQEGLKVYRRMNSDKPKLTAKAISAGGVSTCLTFEQRFMNEWRAKTALKITALRRDMAESGIDYDEFISRAEKNDTEV